MGNTMVAIYLACLHRLSNCFGSDNESCQRTEKPGIDLLRDQTVLVPTPSAALAWTDEHFGSPGTRVDRTAKKAGNAAKTLWGSCTTSGCTRRPQISAPSNFQHVYSASHTASAAAPSRPRRPRRPSFQPLELRMYAPNKTLSSTHALFDFEGAATLAEPASAHTNKKDSWDGSNMTLTPERSHLSRRPVHQETSWSSLSQDSTRPRATCSRPQGWPRSHTSPCLGAAHHSDMIERIVSATIEKDQLQRAIHDVAERQCIFCCSRPTTPMMGLQGASRSRTAKIVFCLLTWAAELEPMPWIPALPAAASSYTEQIGRSSNGEQELRPRAASSLPHAQCYLAHHFGHRPRPTAPVMPLFFGYERKAAPEQVSEPPGKRHSWGGNDDFGLVSLVLLPPLRKKKSFVRVSSWFLPDGQDDSNAALRQGLDAVASTPRPVAAGQ